MFYSFKFIQGSLLFTSSGTQYYHGFNISLFGEPDKSHVICENNVTREDTVSIVTDCSLKIKLITTGLYQLKKYIVINFQYFIVCSKPFLAEFEKNLPLISNVCCI